MTRRTVEVPGGRLAVLDLGSGSPVVLLHAGIVGASAGMPLTGRLAAAITDFLARLPAWA